MGYRGLVVEVRGFIEVYKGLITEDRWFKNGYGSSIEGTGKL